METLAKSFLEYHENHINCLCLKTESECNGSYLNSLEKVI